MRLLPEDIPAALERVAQWSYEMWRSNLKLPESLHHSPWPNAPLAVQDRWIKEAARAFYDVRD